jgi:non-lysosomal glucosylceramidase
MLPLYLRMRAYMKQQTEAGFDPINMAPEERGEPREGVPLGGIGCGSIGRGWRGDFRRWQLRPGFVQPNPVLADAFTVRVERAGEEPVAQVLFPGRPEDGSLSAWRWDMPADKGAYHALFPRAWTVYEEPVPGVRLTCRQVSPVIPHNYRESSLPAAVFNWTIENLQDTPAAVSLMFTFQNGVGGENDRFGGHFNQPFSESMPENDQGIEAVTGVTLFHVHRQRKGVRFGEKSDELIITEDPLTFAIAAAKTEDVQVTYYTCFDPGGSGEAVWQDFVEDGRLDNQDDRCPSKQGQVIGAAVAVSVELPPLQQREVAFSLVWDMPKVRTGIGTDYYRRYSLFYGRDSESAPALARDALMDYRSWEAQIEAWQRAVLDNPELPDWYKQALFNELYYIVDGGTLWAYPSDRPLFDEKEMGNFAYLEGHHYPMYNTYDVHFYASFALAMLWPEIELSLQRDIARAVPVDQPEQRRMMYNGRLAPRKVSGAVSHDVGWPHEDPWRVLNGYYFHNPNEWKDLNPKFVLQVYRDYVLTENRQFLEDVWPAVKSAVEFVARYDTDGDGLIENTGFPDQTYDTWTVRGPSAYTGGLWLACLSAAAALADELGEPELAHRYRQMYGRGCLAYEQRLWNGQYFNYDSSRSRHHNSIMADQLAGNWYALASGLPPIASPQQARSALETIFQHNVMGFQGGSMGAVNGMRPDGKVDRTNMQSQEVWVGTTYALAAAMLQQGMTEQAFQTAKGAVETTYNTRGYWFQTPEAWDENGDYRSLTYMRPLAIWAMQWEIQRRKK